MDDNTLYPRHLRQCLQEALHDSPVVLIHGPRQCGKTTLAKVVGEEDGYDYITFDDEVQRAAAQADPIGFVADLPVRVILDEVQRVPALFTSLKRAVDKQRTPGRFILTGSANVLLLPSLSDSLAGRMEILRLHPFSQAERTRIRPHFLHELFTSPIRSGTAGRRLGKDLAIRVAAGGYPAALARTSPSRRSKWYRDYIETLVQRDIRDLAQIEALHAIPRLLALAAGQTACLVNISELAGPFQLSRPTIRQYATLLAKMFLLEELPAWHSNRVKRLIKTPKMHLCDTGVACALLDMDADAIWKDRTMFGRLLETFALQELRRQASCFEDNIAFSHFRDKDMVEVDIVLESAGRLAGIEVKASSTVSDNDFRGLRKLQAAAGKKFTAGVLLYDGDAVASFGPQLHAMPLSRLWEEE
jgi:predicted AAA+ superfamily ATPase